MLGHGTAVQSHGPCGVLKARVLEFFGDQESGETSGFIAAPVIYQAKQKTKSKSRVYGFVQLSSTDSFLRLHAHPLSNTRERASTQRWPRVQR